MDKYLEEALSVPCPYPSCLATEGEECRISPSAGKRFHSVRRSPMDHYLKESLSVPCPNPSCLAAEGEECRISPMVGKRFHSHRRVLAFIGPCSNCGAKERELCKTDIGTLTTGWHASRQKEVREMQFSWELMNRKGQLQLEEEFQQAKEDLQKAEHQFQQTKEEFQMLEQQGRESGLIMREEWHKSKDELLQLREELVDLKREQLRRMERLFRYLGFESRDA